MEMHINRNENLNYFLYLICKLNKQFFLLFRRKKSLLLENKTSFTRILYSFHQISNKSVNELIILLEVYLPSS
jgi:hypothetical protein